MLVVVKFIQEKYTFIFIMNSEPYLLEI